MPELLIPLILVISGFLIVTAVVQHYSRRIAIPSVTIMLFFGAMIALLPIQGFEIGEVFTSAENKISEIILLVLIPLLIFESGRKFKFADLKKEAVHIGFFAVVGVILTVFLIASAIVLVFEIPFIHAILLGSILAATDPVAVGVIFQRFPIPHRLRVLIEGESLLNDATGVISFSVVKGIIFAGISFSVLDTSLSFLWSMAGAMAFGSAIGWITGQVLKKWNDDEHVDFTVSVAVAVGSYVIADQFLHVSGVVTTLFVAMLILSTHKSMIREVKTLFHKYWDYLGFITNSILFFLIGIPLFFLETTFPWYLIIIMPIVIILATRAALVYGGNAFLLLFKIKVPIKWQNVLTFGGMRGGMAIALVLSLPVTYEYKDLFLAFILSLVTINLVLNPIILNQYLKKVKLG